MTEQLRYKINAKIFKACSIGFIYWPSIFAGKYAQINGFEF
jgi:hypothetical protein